MNANEIRFSAREKTLNALSQFLKDNNAIQFDDASFAIPQEVDGMTIYTEISVKTKAWKDTKVSSAFNPQDAIAKWEAEKAEAARKAEEKAAEKKKRA